MRRAMVVAVVAVVLGACGSSDDTESTDVTSSTTVDPTTTGSPVTTSTTTASTITTPSVDVNIVTAEALTGAIYAGDPAAIDELPWANPGSPARADAKTAALFEAALNVQVVAFSCRGETAEVVTCRTQATDDLNDALGAGVYTDTHVIGFNESGEITELATEIQDGGVREVFTSWAWGIAHPGLCESPAQCAEALVGVVDEYNETYPAAVVASYIAAYNARDLDEVMTFFTEDSVVTGHPFAASSVGLAEIRGVHQADINAASEENPYTISNVEVSGDTVTWDHLWVNSTGDRFCQIGQEAVVENGTFVTWTWPSDGFDCP